MTVPIIKTSEKTRREEPNSAYHPEVVEKREYKEKKRVKIG